MEKISVTIPEAVAMTGIGRSSLYKIIKDGGLTPRKCGGRTLLLADQLRRYVENLPTIAAAS